MKRVELTIKEIEARLLKGDVSEAWLARLQQDPRKGVQKLLAQRQQKLEREHRLREQWDNMSRFERFYRGQGLPLVAGVDEAGRGPLAGPVVAAAVMLPDGCIIPGLNDSKKLSAAERERLYNEIDRCAIDWAAAAVSAHRIDEINIYRASLEAMTLAVKKLRPFPDVLLNDAVLLEDFKIVQEKIAGGDRQSVSIAAASVMAKVTRDRLMTALDKQYPEYNFAQNKGYGTAEHLQALREYGPTDAHRRSFAPVRRETPATPASP